MHSEAGAEKVLARAYRILATRPRSEEELRRKLRSAGFREDAIEEAVDRLRTQNLLDDEAFAASWTQSRMRFRPRSKHLIQRELRGKGVSSENAEEATRHLDDDETALALATRRMKMLRGLDRETRVRRLSGYLRTRGFGRDTVARTIASVLDIDESS